MGSVISVLCVDDHPLMREGVERALAQVPDMRLVAEACDGRRALEAWRMHRPDVTVMDLQMPRLDGIAAMTAIRAEFPQARFVVLSDVGGAAIEGRARRAGASAFLGKTSGGEALVAAIRQACRGGTTPGPEAVDLDALTSRELEILRWAARGQSNRDIASRVGLAESTVNNYMKKILLKLRAVDRTHAVTLAMRQGLLDVRQ
jgi:two-component system NarL family response regulator